MTAERLHELEQCIDQIADPVIAGWMGELFDALTAAEDRIAELTATIEGQRLALEELERQMNEEKLKHEDMRVHLRGIIWELRLWAQEAQTHLQNTLWQLGNSAPLEAFLTRPLPGEEDR